MLNRIVMVMRSFSKENNCHACEPLPLCILILTIYFLLSDTLIGGAKYLLNERLETNYRVVR